MYCKRTNFWINESVSVLIQVFAIFAFLTVFFFGYVVRVEEEEFENQLRLIVDKLMGEIKPQLADVIDGKELLRRPEVVVLINGAIGVIQDKIERSSSDIKEEIRAQNRVLRNKVYMALGIFAVVLAVMVAGVLALGFCVPLRQFVKNTAIIVGVVGVTELAFLKLIAGKYVAADPNAVKKTLGETLKVWIERTYPEKLV